VKILQCALYAKMGCLQFWEKILCVQHQEFPNLPLLVELALHMSGSSSSVERSFSILTLVLSDHCLGMSHDMMEKCMIITSNDKHWTKQEKKMLIHCAVDVYMQKRRAKFLTSKKTVKNIATTNVQISGELAHCSTMEENSSDVERDSELDKFRIFQFRQ